tara:strand:- start:36 stop:296 length:261 start_codon:yes stop_codon:yes gene_type:complete
MAIPKGQNKKSLLNKSKDKVVKVASGGQGIKELQSLFESAMFAMGEGFTGPDASAADVGLYHNGRDKAIKYGKLLRQKGVMVKLPR